MKKKLDFFLVYTRELVEGFVPRKIVGALNHVLLKALLATI